MADKDDDGPSLELPSLGFGRKRGKKQRDAAADAPVAPAPAPSVTEPAPEPAPEPATEVEEPTTVTQPAVEAETAPTVTPPDAERTTRHVPPVPPPEPAAPPLFADEVHDSPTRFDNAPVAALDDESGESTEPAGPVAAKPKRQVRLPALNPMTAALVTGAVVGVLMVGLTGLGFRFCELVQGAPSCGDPGFLLLLAIVIVMILVGKALMAAWDLQDPGSTSFLAVGLLAVVALLFLVDVLFNWWMIIVIPLVSMVCFALSHWVTTAFVDDE